MSCLFSSARSQQWPTPIAAQPSEAGTATSITSALSLSRPLCKTLEELTDALVDNIEAATRSTVPECTTSELMLALSAMVPLHRPIIGPYAEGGNRDLPAEYKTNWIASSKNGKKQYPQASAYAIVYANGHEARQTVQRAASRGILTAIEKADGFKYSFNNAWAAKDDDGMRFSYICQDSTQNRDRHANGFPKTVKRLKGAGERGSWKETFDCKGSISVKYSLQEGTLEVIYKHYAIHPKVKERTPYPRAPRKLKTPNYSSPLPSVSLDQSTSQNVSQGDKEPAGLFGKLQNMSSAYREPSTSSKPQAMVEANTSQASNTNRPLKRKREDKTVYSRPPGKVLSLTEILRQSQIAKPQPNSKQTNTPRLDGAAHQPPMEYSLPSWQMPPPAPPPPVKTKPLPARSTQPANPPPSYQQPYQPQKPYQPLWPSHPATEQERLGFLHKEPKSQGLFTIMKQGRGDLQTTSTQTSSHPGYGAEARAADYPPSLRTFPQQWEDTWFNCRYSKRQVCSLAHRPSVPIWLTLISAIQSVRFVVSVPRDRSSIVSMRRSMRLLLRTSIRGCQGSRFRCRWL